MLLRLLIDTPPVSPAVYFHKYPWLTSVRLLPHADHPDFTSYMHMDFCLGIYPMGAIERIGTPTRGGSATVITPPPSLPYSFTG